MSGECLHKQDASVKKVPMVVVQKCIPVTLSPSKVALNNGIVKRCISRKRMQSNNLIVCPVCGLSLKGAAQICGHFQKEVKLLNEIGCGPSLRKRMRLRASGRALHCSNSSECDSGISIPTPEADLQSRTIVFKQIQQRRYLRYAEMHLFSASVRCVQRLISADCASAPLFNDSPGSYTITSCPVCSVSVENTRTEGAQHVSKCFAKKDGYSELFTSGDEDAESAEYEEYTFAGQTRVRAVTLFEEDLAVLDGCATRIQMANCDDDLDVDGESDFGKDQYSESDIIPLSANEPEENQIRKVIREALAAPSLSSSNEKYLQPNSAPALDFCRQSEGDIRGNDVEQEPVRYLSLKREAQNEEDDSVRCFICMSTYRNPVVSISCWHVCCEECWMRSLGAKKVCPKCNTIVSSAQLRKIFL